jgi:hypothetical protein
MILVVKLFGVIPVLTVELPHSVEVEVDDEDEDDPRIEGGSAHNFERDMDPLKPEDRYDWEWEDRKRGFGFR